MVEEVRTSNTTRIAERSWRAMSLKQRKTIVRNLGYDESFAQPKTFRELVKRGGGMVARDFHNVVKEFARRNPNIKIVRFS